MQVDVRFVDVSAAKASDGRYYCTQQIKPGEHWVSIAGPVIQEVLQTQQVLRAGVVSFPLVPYRTSSDCTAMIAFAVQLALSLGSALGPTVSRIVAAVGHPIAHAVDDAEQAVVYLGFAYQVGY